ncbi:MAG: hypothetical protein DWQ07_18275 [Chloroflexi bacterium]|nr:MAG: hypothetical protein DWQ07_18275 [Chloroflexota bacterium]MBL1197370.1 hypothetical protein [Chloroflexota bacterium]
MNSTKLWLILLAMVARWSKVVLWYAVLNAAMRCRLKRNLWVGYESYVDSLRNDSQQYRRF